ncbi:MAG: ABC transporter ATP-binding protein [Flavobacteriales bacterium]|nr:ABC transporter ATP-binding protein [Flavobacteriales bacterium]
MSAITVNGLCKTYLLQNGETAEFEALRDVTFSVEGGESVGIIGHNGAGKSTLLKILSGITLPSSGEGKVVGSFSSLLEVGIGFHPDLTGRDNIYFNASILGVSRATIQTEMEQIIAFSGVEKFIDQPLRTYSSGMKLRLAFAIIAHLKTDIIALDEVLAVGDSMFQVKCMERIFDFKNQGRTILFVSHNLSAVKRLCDRTLVLENGRLIFDGPTDEAISTYLNRVGQSGAQQDGLLTSHTLDVSETVAKIELFLMEFQLILRWILASIFVHQMARHFIISATGLMPVFCNLRTEK